MCGIYHFEVKKNCNLLAFVFVSGAWGLAQTEDISQSAILLPLIRWYTATVGRIVNLSSFLHDEIS